MLAKVLVKMLIMAEYNGAPTAKIAHVQVVRVHLRCPDAAPLLLLVVGSLQCFRVVRLHFKRVTRSEVTPAS